MKSKKKSTTFFVQKVPRKLLISILVIILEGFAVGFLGYFLGIHHQQNDKKPMPVSAPVKQQISCASTPTPAIAASNARANASCKDSIPYWSDPSGSYHVYSTCDNNSNCAVYVITHEDTPHTIKTLSLNDFHGGFSDILWAPINLYNDVDHSKFILKVFGPGDGHTYYLVYLNGTPAVKLNLESSLVSYDEILSWIDKDRILIKHTIDDGNTTHITYEVAPVTDVSQKKIVSF